MKKLLMLCLCLALLCGAVPAQGEETELRVLTYYLNDEWVQGFEQAHPGARVIVDDSMSVQDALVTGLPVYVIVTATDTSFADMVQKGYVRPLEDQALAARFQRLLPPLRQALTVSGQPYGFPSGLLLETWTLNVTPYEEVGFQDADAPATVAAFLDQLRLWIEDLRAEHTGYFCPQKETSSSSSFVIFFKRINLASLSFGKQAKACSLPVYHNCAAF